MSVRDITGASMSDDRKEDLKHYQRQRAALRRSRGIVSRTVWIREEDDNIFRGKVEGLVHHARLIEAVTGGPSLSVAEISEIIAKYGLPYEPADFVFLARIKEEIILKPEKRESIIGRAL
jgi:hypothetical protein